jgi:hypothetical protein
MNISINGLPISRKADSYQVIKPIGVGYMTSVNFYILGDTLADLIDRVRSHTKQFRCTINALYSSPNCDGYSDYSCRNGHYVEAISPVHAKQLMAIKYPEYVEGGFTAE